MEWETSTLPGLGQFAELDDAKRRRSELASRATCETAGMNGRDNLRLLRPPDPVAVPKRRTDRCGRSDCILGGREDAHRLGPRHARPGLWGALNRFRLRGASCGRRFVGRTSTFRGAVLVLVVLVSGVPLRAPARPPSPSFNRVQGAGDRRAPASAGSASSAGRSAAADDDRSCLPGCCESAVAALALAVVPGHADNAAALAPAAGRAPVDVRRSARSAADRRRDPRVGASPRRARIRAGATSGSSAS